MAETEVKYPKIYPSLESSVFREVIETRSEDVEDVLNNLKTGSQLWKIRSLSKWSYNRYFLDIRRGKILKEENHKPHCIPNRNGIKIEEILEVRRGWKTDNFNRIARKQKKEKHIKLILGPVPSKFDESCCFSIIYGSSKQSLDLIASNKDTADMWIEGLNHLVTVLQSLKREEKYKRWLKRQFDMADVDQNKHLNFEECVILIRNLQAEIPKDIIRKKFDEANVNKVLINGQQVLDAEEFSNFYLKLVKRPEIEEIFSRYESKSKTLDSEKLSLFLRCEQNQEKLIKDCLHLIEAFEPSKIKHSGELSIIGFKNLLMSDEFELLKKQHRNIYQDMNQPLSQYFIASSHNTYLTGDQLTSESSVETYIKVLKMGCRFVELDLWDGEDDEPEIYHGRTLTSRILLKDVLTDAIKPYAFYKSEYPLILSLENHCSVKQQNVAVKYFKSILKDFLYTDPAKPQMEFLPSPEALKKKIVIKGKKLKCTSNKSSLVKTECDEECNLFRDEVCVSTVKNGIKIECSNEKVITSTQTVNKCDVKVELSKELSDLINICQSGHFHGFDKPGKCYEVISLQEEKVEKMIQTSGSKLVNYNRKQLIKVYPAGSRIGSSNFNPIPFWNAGCQIAALNYQREDKYVFLNEAKFFVNGGCGYILKPNFLLEKMEYDPLKILNGYKKILQIKIISGQLLQNNENCKDGDIVDPYVKVKIFGHLSDKQKSQTEVIKNNGFNPRWNFNMSFTINMPDLAVVQYIVKDKKFSGKDPILGSYALPFNSISEGYRHIFLMDYGRNIISPSSLFVHTKICD